MYYHKNAEQIFSQTISFASLKINVFLLRVVRLSKVKLRSEWCIIKMQIIQIGPDLFDRSVLKLTSGI